MKPSSLFPLLVLMLTPAAWSQEPQALVQGGYVVPGAGVVQYVSNFAINDAGSTLVQAHISGGAAGTIFVILRDGVLYLQEGTELPQLPGTTLDYFGAFDLNSSGDVGWTFTLGGVPPGLRPVLFHNTNLLIQAGTFSAAPEFSPGTPYLGFAGAMLNDSNQMLVGAAVDDPNIAGAYNAALMRIDIDADGGLISESAFLKEGDAAPGTGGATIIRFGAGAFNNDGQIMYTADLGHDVEPDAVFIDTTLLAMEGLASPIDGRLWSRLSSVIDLNNKGDYVFSGYLSGDPATDRVAIKNGAKFVQTGDTLPAIGGVHQITSFGGLHINDLGEVLWYGHWNDPNTNQNSGLFIDDELIVQEGVTTIDGLSIGNIQAQNFTMSPNGRYILFEAQLFGGTQGAYLIDRRPLGNGYCVAAPNSTGQGASLSAAGSSAIADADVTLTAEDLPPGVFGLFFLGPDQIQTSFGDGFRCVGGMTDRVQPSLMASSAGIAVRALNFGAPYASGIVPGSVNFQLWYRDPTGPGGTGFNVSDGLEITFN